MKPWIGHWLMGTAVLHTAYAVVAHGPVLSSIVERGVFNTVRGDPATAAAVWFVLFGVLVGVCALAVRALEKASPAPLPRAIGWSLLGLGVLAVTLMPASGVWIIFPPAIGVLLQKPNGLRAASVT